MTIAHTPRSFAHIHHPSMVLMRRVIGVVADHQPKRFFAVRRTDTDAVPVRPPRKQLCYLPRHSKCTEKK